MAFTLRPGMVRLGPFRVNISNQLTVSSVSIKILRLSFIVWSRTRKPGLSFVDGPSRANWAVSARKKEHPTPVEDCPSFFKVMLWLTMGGLAILAVLAVVVGLAIWL